MGKSRKIIFLDRDGVLTPSKEINGIPTPVFNYGDKLDSQIQKKILNIKSSTGAIFFMVTNQPDIARGKRKFADLERENIQVSNFYHLDGWEMCPHDRSDLCFCRKPKEGMAKKLMERFNIGEKNFSRFVIGDRKADVDFASRINATGLFIDHGYEENKNIYIKNKKFDSTLRALEYIDNF